MKQRTALLMILLALFLILCGCTDGSSSDDRILLFYPNHQMTYGSSDSLITAEAADHTEEEPVVILQRYLSGPSDLTLRNPFPSNTKLLSVKQKDRQTTLVLSNEFAALEGIELTIACTCLAKTTIALTGATTVAITCETAPLDGEQTLLFRADGMLLLDESTGPLNIETSPTSVPQ